MPCAVAKPICRYSASRYSPASRVLRQPDGSYQRLCRELIFYKDLKSGELMDQWDNVLTGERVKVVDVANDPFNYIISEYFPTRRATAA